MQKLNARQVHTHSSEGYAVDWSAVAEGALASGDCRARIHLWAPQPGGRWAVGGACRGHEGSVEDLQWSPCEATVFASCSVDRTIRIWDTRDAVRGSRRCPKPAQAAAGAGRLRVAPPPVPSLVAPLGPRLATHARLPPCAQSKPQLTVAAHEADVNVISWNRGTPYMLASGGDDGVLRVWDLRHFAGALVVGWWVGGWGVGGMCVCVCVWCVWVGGGEGGGAATGRHRALLLPLHAQLVVFRRPPLA